MTKTGMTRTPRAPRVVVEVTEEIIASSERKDSSHCMIAEAVKAAVPVATSVSVDLQTIRWTDKEKGLRYTYLTPRTAQYALVSFDEGVHTEPFTIKLAKAQVTRAGRMKPGRAVGKGSADPAAMPRETEFRPEAGKVPRIVGGTPPPRGSLGRRREYGMRGFRAPSQQDTATE